jgi:hypothetical protein
MLLLAFLFLQAIKGAHTPACLSAARDSVETVTPPCGDWLRWRYGTEKELFLFYAVFDQDSVSRSIDCHSPRSMPSRICCGVLPCLVML